MGLPWLTIHYDQGQGGGNCSVPYTINTLGGGHMVLKTLTTDEGNCGGLP